MHILSKFVFVVLIMVGGFAGEATAKRVALIVANGAYEQTSALPNITNDAREMTASLQTAGFEVIQVIDADKRAIERAVRNFSRAIRGAEAALFYFNGLAIQSTGENYLLPVDVQIQDIADLEFEAVRLNSIVRLMRQERRPNIIILDASRQNAFTTVLMRRAPNSVSRGLARVKGGTDFLVAYPAAPGEIAPEIRRGDRFSVALAKQMRTPGLPLADVFTRLRRSLNKATSGQAVPWVDSSLTRPFVLIAGAKTAGQSGSRGSDQSGRRADDDDEDTPGSGDGGTVVRDGGGAPGSRGDSGTGGASAAEVAFWQSIKDSTDPEDFKSYLKRFPQGLFSDLARRRMQKYASGGGQSGGTTAVRTPERPRTMPRRTVSLKGQNVFPNTLPFAQDGAEVAKALERNSKGRIKLELFRPGAVVASFETIDAVKNGILDTGWGISSYWARKSPAFTILGGNYPFGPKPERLYAWARSKGQQHYDELYGKQGIKAFPCGMIGPEGGGWYKKPIKGIRSFRRMKIRFFGLGSRVVAKVGASPQLLAGGDIYPALESGAIDATEFSTPELDAKLGFYRIARYYYYPAWHQPAGLLDLMINKDRWDQLEPAARKLIEFTCADALAKAVRRIPDRQRKGLDQLRSKGVTVRTFPRDVLEALRAAADEVLAKEASKSAEFRRVYESIREYGQ